MLDVNTIKGSLVSEKIAGTESIAKTMSVSSKKTKAKNNGVTKRTPFILVKKFGREKG